MKRYIISTIAVISVLTLSVSLYAGGGGGRGGAAGGMGGAMGGGGRGGATQVRLDKAGRLDAITQLETQVAALKKAIQDGPEYDFASLEQGSEEYTEAMTSYTPERTAVRDIQTTMASLLGGGARGFGGGTSAEVLTELKDLATKAKATKTEARLAELITEAEARAATRGQGRGQGGQGMGGAGGMMGGGAGGAGGMMGGGAGRGGRGGAGGV